jgi:hypothetical protein
MCWLNFAKVGVLFCVAWLQPWRQTDCPSSPRAPLWRSCLPSTCWAATRTDRTDARADRWTGRGSSSGDTGKRMIHGITWITLQGFYNPLNTPNRSQTTETNSFIGADAFLGLVKEMYAYCFTPTDTGWSVFLLSDRQEEEEKFQFYLLTQTLRVQKPWPK